jgi:hypothetical protein
MKARLYEKGVSTKELSKKKGLRHQRTVTVRRDFFVSRSRFHEPPKSAFAGNAIFVF